MDEAAYRAHLRRCRAAGLRVAVNMDTGYGDLLSPAERERVLGWALQEHQDERNRDRRVLPGAGPDWFVAGVLVAAGERRPLLAYARAAARATARGAVPIIFPSASLARLPDSDWIRLFREVGAAAGRFLAFELGRMFSPHGRIFSDPILHALLDLPSCLGLKHSSLRRDLEWDRLRLRNRLRPDFVIYSGNDLAADMIEYGSDYLLGLSTFAPELFAARDRAWAEGSPDYLSYRDFIQYLGWLGFRSPTPAYKHSAAIFLHRTGGLPCDATHPRAPRRDAWDRQALADAAARLAELGW